MIFCSLFTDTPKEHDFCQYINSNVLHDGAATAAASADVIFIVYFFLFSPPNWQKFHRHRELIHVCWIFFTWNWLKALTNLIIFFTNNQRTNKNMVGLYPVFANVCRLNKRISVSQNCWICCFSFRFSTFSVCVLRKTRMICTNKCAFVFFDRA